MTRIAAKIRFLVVKVKVSGTQQPIFKRGGPGKSCRVLVVDFIPSRAREKPIKTSLLRKGRVKSRTDPGSVS